MSGVGRIVVLHVDDEPEFANLTAEMLEQEDDRFTVETTTRASDALDFLADHDVNCIVSDYEMPGETGIDFLEAVRDRYPDLPFILYTGKGSEEIASEAITAGVTEYLQKEAGSSQYTVLANRIRNAVDKYHSRQAVKETEQKLSELAENTDEILFMFDSDWSELLFINSAYEEVWNQSIEELKANPRSFLGNIHPDDQELVEQTLEQILAGEPTEVEHRILTDEGDVRWIYSEAKPVFNDEGEFSRIVGFVRDITDTKEYEAELERQNERLDEFASIVSHELQSPLTVASGRLELAQEECSSEELERAMDAIERSQALVSDLLTFAREGEDVNEVEPVMLSDLTTTCWQNVVTDDADLEIETDQTIRADRSRLSQLLENLIRNAVEHAGEDTSVIVGETEAGFYVADDGPGIPPAESDEVFEPGYSTADDSTGFGLAIVKQIADAHGWDIRVCESEDGGARFEISGVEPAAVG